MTTWGDLLKEAGTVTQGYDPLPSGTYDVTVEKAEHKIAQSGKSMFEVQFKVISGPHANRFVWNRFVVVPDSPRALAYFFSNMRALGLDSDFFAASPSDDVVASALVGRTVTIEVGQTEYNGALRNEVKKVLASKGATATVAAPVASAPAAPVTPMSAPAPTPTSAPVAPAAPF